MCGAPPMGRIPEAASCAYGCGSVKRKVKGRDDYNFGGDMVRLDGAQIDSGADHRHLRFRSSQATHPINASATIQTTTAMRPSTDDGAARGRCGSPCVAINVAVCSPW